MSIEIGKYHLLNIRKETGIDFIFEEEGESIKLPKKDLRNNLKVGDEVNVFIYTDLNGKLVATISKPFAMVGECAYMEVKEESSIGAFMYWGIEKDLLVPFSQQKDTMREGNSYLVYVYIDEQTGRITGTSKLKRYINNEELTVKEGEKVDLLICHNTDLGTQVIVNNKHWGLLYKNEIFQKIKRGDKLKGYIKKIREEGKLDVSLQEQSYDEAISASLKILKRLKEQQGFLPITDKTDPSIIYDELQMSKKTFKKAIGALFKERRIMLEDKGIRLI